ncbi:MAG: choice-of-anchor tandem repeat GloVer-containing protein [Rhizomicrobium sp.]|jgi:uncharacterized repeat protein (TIGR03803 family)
MRAIRQLLNSHLCGSFVLIAMSMLCGNLAANAAEKVLHIFKGGKDGAVPFGGFIADNNGTLYGTTAGGGRGCKSGGCGTVFSLSPSGKERVLYAFKGGADGAGPYDSSLLMDQAGNLYGTTIEGGGCTQQPLGCGTVFKLAPNGTETVLYAFQGGSDGYLPIGGVIADNNGDLFGTTGDGGSYNGECAGTGCGTVFEVQPNGNKITLYTFQGGSDGAGPDGGLVADTSGNLYGTTSTGGTVGGACSDQYGCGTVFKIAPDGTETVLYTFQGGSDGWEPEAGLITDNAGNMYGTTYAGGDNDVGTVFEITPSGAEAVFYSFGGGSDGANPRAALTIDGSGNLYGTTWIGGDAKCKKGKNGTAGCGTVFKLAPDGTESVLYAFAGQSASGAFPVAPVLLQGSDLYGTTNGGGNHNNGVAFSVKK